MMIRRMIFVIGMISILCSCELWAATVNCNGSQSDCQAKVNAAVDGDVVAIPAGTFSWGSAVSWTDKNITVQGQGIGVTVLNLSGTAFSVTDTNKASFRITGITLSGGGGGNGQIYLDSSNNSSSVYGWRIDHIDFKNSSGMGVYVIGINWGLIDHCSFEGNFVNNAVELYSYVQADYVNGQWLPTGAGGLARGLALHPGSKEAVYIEDSTLTPTNCSTSGPGGVNDSSFSARMVFRHNRVSCLYFQSHSTRNNDRGGNMWMEVYNNTWTGNNFSRVALIRSGTGVIFNNTISGYQSNDFSIDNTRVGIDGGSQYYYCDGTHAWDGNIESTGWPCMDQIGRGQGTLGHEPSLPFLAWNNGTASTCASGGTCTNTSTFVLNESSMAPYIATTAHSNGDKDFCVGTSTMPATCGNYTSTYTPFTYPHPLTSGTSGGGTPNPPTALQATIQ